MPNVTLAMDEEFLASARAFAKAEGTTLNALMRKLVADAIDQKVRREEARRGLIALMESSEGLTGKPMKKINRDEMYGGPLLPRHKRSDLRRSRGKG